MRLCLWPIPSSVTVAAISITVLTVPTTARLRYFCLPTQGYVMIHHPIGDKAYDETPGCAPVRQLRLCVQICLKKTRYCLGQSQHEDLGRIAWRELPRFR